MFKTLKKNQMKKDRQPIVAGSFYTDDADELKNEVERYFKNAISRKNDAIVVVAPHAGYVFSGQVAANAINQLNPKKNYDNIFLIGSSHSISFGGASIYNVGDYKIPEATIKVNQKLASKLIENNSVFEYNKNAHNQEHSLEVQLPFLYYHLKNNFRIIPIIIGTNNIETIKEIAKALKPYFNDKNAFVLSSDFSHYPNYDEATKNDKRTAEAFIKNSPNKFIEILEENSRKNIKNLSTSACGWTSLLTLLYITKNNKKYHFQLIDYKNSGDSKYGSNDEVVGYYAISVYKKKSFLLTEKEKTDLKKIAQQTLRKNILNDKISKIKEKDLSENLKMNIGAFVTLYNNGQLRGCIGQFLPNIPLYKVVQEMTISASQFDSRFSPVSANELDNISIEISVLTPLQKISNQNEIKIGRDGIYIVKDGRSGTFLPQVATENNWNALQFLEYCSEHKVGIGKNGWKKAKLFIYQAIVF